MAGFLLVVGLANRFFDPRSSAFICGSTAFFLTATHQLRSFAVQFLRYPLWHGLTDRAIAVSFLSRGWCISRSNSSESRVFRVSKQVRPIPVDRPCSSLQPKPVAAHLLTFPLSPLRPRQTRRTVLLWLRLRGSLNREPRQTTRKEKKTPVQNREPRQTTRKEKKTPVQPQMDTDEHRLSSQRWGETPSSPNSYPL